MKNSFPKAGYALLFALAACTNLLGQSTEELLEKANKQYNLYAYNLAVRSYRTVLERDPNNADAVGKLADCYRQLNQPDEAIKWYDRAASMPAANPAILLNQGKTMMSLGRYDEAKRIFQNYAEGNQNVGNHFAAMCDFARSHADDASDFRVKNEVANSPAADFGASFFMGNKVVWSSSRSDMPRSASKKEAAGWSGESLNQLFVAARDANGFLQKPAFLKSDLENNFNEGPAAFSANSERVAYCRNNFMDGSRQVSAPGVSMSLFVGDVFDGKWANTKAFSYNGDYSTGWPAFSPDGKTLFFSSNREGGNGGWDIYACTFNGKNWDSPQNLGPAVNSPGDEITPFYDGKTLFFASDWHDGFGGMDIFRAETEGNEFRKIWHLGPSVNSSRDDYGFIFDDKLQLGYFTSNRKGGKGNEDIWQVTRQGEACKITVVSAGDKKLLAGAEIDFADCGGKKVAADKNGVLEFTLVSGAADCKIVVRRAGFEAVAVPVFAGMKAKSIVVELKKAALDYSEPTVDLAPTTYSTGQQNSPSGQATTTSTKPAGPKNFDGEYTGFVINADTKGLLENVVVKAQPQPKGPEMETNSDADGRFGFSFEPGTTYKIVFSRAGFAEEIKAVKADAKAKDLGTIAMRDAYSVIGNPVKQAETARTEPAKSTETPSAKPVESSTTTKTEPSKTEPAKTEPAKTETAATGSAKPELVIFKTDPAKETAPKPVVYTNEKAAEPVKKEGFSVQIASVDGSVDHAFLRKYSNMSTFGGNLFSQLVGKQNKIRVGIFTDKKKADDVQAEAKKLGYRDAFVVEEKDANEQLLVAPPKPAEVAVKPVESSVKTEMVVFKPVAADEKKVGPAEKTAKSPEKESESAILVIANKKEEAPKTELKADEPAPPKRWCVQVAALTNAGEAVDMSAYAALFEFGYVYTIPEKETTKVRVGVWETAEEANEAEVKIRKKGFKDALAMPEKAVYRTEKLLIKKEVTMKSAAPATYSNGKQDKPGTKADISPYKVRVATLSKSKSYDATQFTGLGGQIEKKKEGKSLVVYLTNFVDLEAALNAKNLAVAEGFADAFVVKMEDGKLVKVKL